jgi:hypothetical protein
MLVKGDLGRAAVARPRSGMNPEGLRSQWLPVGELSSLFEWKRSNVGLSVMMVNNDWLFPPLTLRVGVVQTPSPVDKPAGLEDDIAVDRGQRLAI